MILLLACTGARSLAQVYTIPDANFRSYLNVTYPFLLNGSQQLIIANAKSFTGAISCAGMNIHDLSGLQYFHKISMLNCNDNPVTTLPSLDSLTAITSIWAEECSLATLPRIDHLQTLTTLVLKKNHLTALPSLGGLNNLQYLDCSYNQLTALPELNGLINLQKLYCYENKLTALPSLAGLNNLQLLDCFNNNLTAIPSLTSNPLLEVLKCNGNAIHELPPVSHLSHLKEFSVNNNGLVALPDLSANTQLQIIDISGNKLTAVPDLSGYGSLTSVKLNGNQLSFSSLIPQTAHPSFSTVFTVSPQDTLLNYPDIQLNRNATGIVAAGVDANVLSNVYEWYRNGALLPGISGSYISLNPPAHTDSGYYFCKVTNSAPGLAGVTLFVRAAKVSIGPCITSSVFDYSIVSNSCMNGAEVQIDETAMVSAYKPFSYQFIPVNHQDTIKSSSYLTTGIAPGKYDLVITDQNGCSVTLNKYVSIPASDDCDNIITPDGDGIDDNFYIDKAGKAAIYSKEGKLIRELAIPSSWDGSDNTGTLVPLGYYIIIINNQEKIGVIVLN